MSVANKKEFDAEQLTLFDAFVDGGEEQTNTDALVIVCECGSLRLGYKDPIFHSDWCSYKVLSKK